MAPEETQSMQDYSDLPLQQELTWAQSYRAHRTNKTRTPIKSKRSPLNIPLALCRTQSEPPKRKAAKRRHKSPKATQLPLLDRSALSQSEYMEMLAVPNGYAPEGASPPKKPRKKCCRCEIQPCSPRIIQMAIPSKRLVWETWKAYQNFLPVETLARFEQLLNSGKNNLEPKDARFYFKQLERKRQAELRRKRLEKRKKLEELKSLDKKWINAETNKLVDAIAYAFLHFPNITLTFKQMVISQIIIETMNLEKLTKIKSRSTKKPYQKKLMDFSDQVAKWIDSLNEGVDLVPLDSTDLAVMQGVSMRSLSSESEEEEESEEEDEEGEDWDDDLLGSVLADEMFGTKGRKGRKRKGKGKDKQGPYEGDDVEYKNKAFEERTDSAALMTDQEIQTIEKLIAIYEISPLDYLEKEASPDQMPAVTHMDIINMLKEIRDGYTPKIKTHPLLEGVMIDWAKLNDPEQVDERILNKIHEVATVISDWLKTTQSERFPDLAVEAAEEGAPVGEGQADASAPPPAEKAGDETVTEKTPEEIEAAAAETAPEGAAPTEEAAATPQEVVPEAVPEAPPAPAEAAPEAPAEAVPEAPAEAVPEAPAEAVPEAPAEAAPAPEAPADAAAVPETPAEAAPAPEAPADAAAAVTEAPADAAAAPEAPADAAAAPEAPAVTEAPAEVPPETPAEVPEVSAAAEAVTDALAEATAELEPPGEALEAPSEAVPESEAEAAPEEAAPSEEAAVELSEEAEPSQGVLTEIVDTVTEEEPEERVPPEGGDLAEEKPEEGVMEEEIAPAEAKPLEGAAPTEEVPIIHEFKVGDEAPIAKETVKPVEEAPRVEPKGISRKPGARGSDISIPTVIKAHSPSHTQEHDPKTICCLALKVWAVWLLEIAHNAHNWTEWMGEVVAKIRYYNSIVKGQVLLPNGQKKVLYKEDWKNFIAETEGQIIAWRQYSAYATRLSGEIIEKFHNKQVACCPKCLNDNMIKNVVTAHDTVQSLAEAINCAAYWHRYFDNILEKTTVLTQVDTKSEMDSSMTTSTSIDLIELIDSKSMDTDDSTEYELEEISMLS